MASPFSRTLRSLEADGHRRSLLALVPALLFLGAWSAWFLSAKIVLYETTETAWLAAEREAHPIAAPVGGRVSAVRAAISQRVKAGDVLVELEGEEQSTRLDEERARQAACGSSCAKGRRWWTTCARGSGSTTEWTATS